MRKMIVKMDTGFCGCDGIEAILVEDDATQNKIDQIAYEMAMDHASSYEEGDTEEEIQDYYDNVSGFAEDYDPEKHDMLKPGGGSFEEDFKWLAR